MRESERRASPPAPAPQRDFADEADAVALGPPPRPRASGAVAAFHAFTRGPARGAAGVYILGDLFDSWVGDDQRREPFAREVVESLRALTDAGVPVYVARGNRDFLLGEDFARATGAIAAAASRQSSTSHGNAHAAVARRRVLHRRPRLPALPCVVARDPARQRRLLRLPYRLRRWIAAWMRAQEPQRDRAQARGDPRRQRAARSKRAFRAARRRADDPRPHAPPGASSAGRRRHAARAHRACRLGRPRPFPRDRRGRAFAPGTSTDDSRTLLHLSGCRRWHRSSSST